MPNLTKPSSIPMGQITYQRQPLNQRVSLEAPTVETHNDKFIIPPSFPYHNNRRRLSPHRYSLAKSAEVTADDSDVEISSSHKSNQPELSDKQGEFTKWDIERARQSKKAKYQTERIASAGDNTSKTATQRSKKVPSDSSKYLSHNHSASRHLGVPRGKISSSSATSAAQPFCGLTNENVSDKYVNPTSASKSIKEEDIPFTQRSIRNEEEASMLHDALVTQPISNLERVRRHLLVRLAQDSRKRTVRSVARVKESVYHDAVESHVDTVNPVSGTSMSVSYLDGATLTNNPIHQPSVLQQSRLAKTLAIHTQTRSTLAELTPLEGKKMVSLNKSQDKQIQVDQARTTQLTAIAPTEIKAGGLPFHHNDADDRLRSEHERNNDCLSEDLRVSNARVDGEQVKANDENRQVTLAFITVRVTNQDRANGSIARLQHLKLIPRSRNQPAFSSLKLSQL